MMYDDDANSQDSFYKILEKNKEKEKNDQEKLIDGEEDQHENEVREKVEKVHDKLFQSVFSKDKYM